MPPLGFITAANRTQAQADAHARAWATLTPTLNVVGAAPLPKGVRVVLTDLWKDPLCVADMGREFTGFRQLTGSCVGVSTGDAVCTLSCVQRKLTQGTTKAFIPWWGFDYGRCRYNEGDRGQGEGAVDSVMFSTLIKEGCLSITEALDVPTFNTSDGMAISSHDEYAWSDGSSGLHAGCQAIAKQHPLGAAAVCNSTDDMAQAIVNGYPILDGCDNYIGSGSLSGDVALGHYDGRGGHSTCYLGYWDHPSLGPLFLYSNQWDGSTYPQDQSGKGRCCVWVKESVVAKLFQTGGGGGETAALSHLTYFPAQPAVLDWFA